MKVAIVGATGAVGREMVEELAQSSIKDIELELYASPKSEGTGIDFRGKNHLVKAFKVENAGKNQVVLMSAGGSFSREYSKGLASMGSIVIDNSSAWRMYDDIPLIVPEVNGHLLAEFKSGIIANPNCSTIQMVVPLKYLNEEFGLEMVNVTTFQSVSGTGQQGISELTQQVGAQYKFQEPEVKVYPQQIAFNVLSSIGTIDEFGHCEEEVKMVKETRKILEINDLDVMVTTARVPVFNCHSESILVKCKKEFSLSDVKELFRHSAGFDFVEATSQSEHPTPRTVAGSGSIFVNRVRLPQGQEKSQWVQFWNVADNLKKGAATNAVQIFEHLNNR